MDLFEKFREKLEYLKENSSRSRFQACENMSTDIIRTSEFVGYPEGVFVGEFFESLFSNINSVLNFFNVKEEDIRPIQKEIEELIELFSTSLSSNDVNVKSALYDKIVRVRYLVTEFQIRNYREGTRKKRIRPESIPRITIEEE